MVEVLALIVFVFVAETGSVRRPDRTDAIDRDKVRDNARDQFMAMWHTFDWNEQDHHQLDPVDSDSVALSHLKKVRPGRRGANGLSGESGHSGTDGTDAFVDFKPINQKNRRKIRTTIAVTESQLTSFSGTSLSEVNPTEQIIQSTPALSTTQRITTISQAKNKSSVENHS